MDDMAWLRETLTRIEERLFEHFKTDEERFNQIEQKLSQATGSLLMLRWIGGFIVGAASLILIWKS